MGIVWQGRKNPFYQLFCFDKIWVSIHIGLCKLADQICL